MGFDVTAAGRSITTGTEEEHIAVLKPQES